MKKVSVLLVDDHKLIRDGIKAMLDDYDNIAITGEAENGKEALEKLQSGDYDVVLMDINMPEMNGIEATEQISKEIPEVKVLALSMNNQESYISKMLKAGALGYILKDCGEDELVKAIEKVSKGESFFSEQVTSVMMSGYMAKKPNNVVNESFGDEKVTTRETEILSLIANGLTNTQIAEELFISPRTVDTHRRNLLQKFGAKNTAELVKQAIKRNLIE